MSKWGKFLNQFDDLVNFKYDAFSPENCLYSPSPSVNWIFANKAMGIPKGSGVLLFSEPKAGKSLLIQAIIAEMQKRDPEGVAIIFNTEMRGAFQNGLLVGVDPSRTFIFDTNKPENIFDRLEREIVPMIQEGMPLRIVAIDSLNSIAGTKSLAEDRSVNDHVIGDQALTIQKGLQKFMPIIRNYKIVGIATAQIRANLDSGMYGPKEKMAAPWAAKHAFEYFISLKKSNAADDKQDLGGHKFENEEKKDLKGNKEITGHKIFIKMEQSSIGTPGRSGVITLDYKKGIINTHEEVFMLAYNLGIIKREGLSNYTYKNKKINGKYNFANEIKNDPELYKSLLEEIAALEK